MGPYMPISWGGARGVFLGRQSYGSPITHVWGMCKHQFCGRPMQAPFGRSLQAKTESKTNVHSTWSHGRVFLPPIARLRGNPGLTLHQASLSKPHQLAGSKLFPRSSSSTITTAQCGPDYAHWSGSHCSPQNRCAYLWGLSCNNSLWLQPHPE